MKWLEMRQPQVDLARFTFLTRNGGKIPEAVSGWSVSTFVMISFPRGSVIPGIRSALQRVSFCVLFLNFRFPSPREESTLPEAADAIACLFLTNYILLHPRPGASLLLCAFVLLVSVKGELTSKVLCQFKVRHLSNWHTSLKHACKTVLLFWKRSHIQKSNMIS